MLAVADTLQRGEEVRQRGGEAELPEHRPPVRGVRAHQLDARGGRRRAARAASRSRRGRTSGTRRSPRPRPTPSRAPTRARSRPSARSRGSAPSATRRRTGGSPRWSMRECASSAPITKPPVAPIAKPSAASRRREGGRLQERHDRAAAPRGFGRSKSARIIVVDVRHRRRVDGERALSSRSGSRARESPPSSPRGARATASRSTRAPPARLTPAARSTGRSTATDAIRLVLTQWLGSRYGAGSEAHRCGARGAPRADRRRERRAARRLDRHVGDRPRVAPRQGRGDRRDRGDRRGGQPVVHARGRAPSGRC